MEKIPLFDQKKCTLCGRCVTVCPHQILSVYGNQIVAACADRCMLCSHCYAVCPTGAVSFRPDVLAEPRFTTFRSRPAHVAPGRFVPEQLVNFVRSRRSVRKFSDEEVKDAVLEDLIAFAATAPSGSNRQEWHFLAINGRKKVWDLALAIKEFFVHLNRMAANPVVRYGSVLFAGLALLRYHRDHMESVERGIREAEKGKDLLFHSAPALIIVHGPMAGSTPSEDAQYASFQITLLAHALGLGTCYIGYAVESINRAASIRKRLGLPAGHRVHAVLAVGHPDVKFVRPALRKPARVRFL